MRLELDRVCLAYGDALPVLDRLSMTVAGGTICGVVGENGAGKSSLASIVAGTLLATRGAVRLRMGAAEHNLSKIRGLVAQVPQNPRFVGEFDAVDNLFLGAEADRFGGTVIDRARHVELAMVLEQYLFPLPKGRPNTWSLRDAARLTFMRGVVAARPVLVVDEVTSGAVAADKDVYLRVLREYADKGRIVIFVSHDLKEVVNVCDQVEVISRGQAFRWNGGSVQDLREIVFGASDQVFVEHPAKSLKTDKLVVTWGDLTVSVAGGEVGAVYFPRPEPLRDMLALVASERPAGSNESVKVDGRELVSLSLRGRRELGLAIIPGHDRGMALVRELTCLENLALNPRSFRGQPWRQRRGKSATVLSEFSVPKAPDTPIGELSGGNQQKVMIAKELVWLDDGAIVAFNPCSGIDMAARGVALSALRNAAKQGAAVLLLSTEPNDVVAVADFAVSLCSTERVWRSGASSEELCGLADLVQSRRIVAAE